MISKNTHETTKRKLEDQEEEDKSIVSVNKYQKTTSDLSSTKIKNQTKNIDNSNESSTQNKEKESALQPLNDDNSKSQKTVKEEIRLLLEIYSKLHSTRLSSKFYPEEENQTVLLAIGDESHGKSSVIQALRGGRVKIPVGDGKCTRFNIKTIPVSTNHITKGYRFKLWKNGKFFGNESSWYPMLFLDENQLVTSLSDRFKSYGESVDYKTLMTLEYVDDDALKLVIIDTPGPSAGSFSKDEEEIWLKNINEIDGCKNPVVLLVTRASRDLGTACSTILVSRDIETRFKNSKIVMVVTHIDLFVDNASKSDTETILQSIKKMRTLFEDCLSFSIVFVQTGFSDKKERTYDEERQIEMNTISKLDQRILNDKSILKGVEQLLNLILENHISCLKVEYLDKIGAILDEQIKKLTNTLIIKNTVISPSLEAVKVMNILSNSYRCVLDVETKLQTTLFNHIIDIMETIDPPNPFTVKSNGIFTFSTIPKSIAADIDFKITTDIIGNCINLLMNQVSEFIDIYFDTYKKFALKALKCYKSFKKLYCIVVDQLDQFLSSELKKTIMNEMNFIFGLHKEFTSINPKTQINIKWPHNFKWGNDKWGHENEVVTTVKLVLLKNIESLEGCLVMLFSQHLTKGFPIHINEYLVSLGKTWIEGDEQEINQLNQDLLHLEDAKKKLSELSLGKISEGKQQLDG